MSKTTTMAALPEAVERAVRRLRHEVTVTQDARAREVWGNDAAVRLRNKIRDALAEAEARGRAAALAAIPAQKPPPVIDDEHERGYVNGWNAAVLETASEIGAAAAALAQNGGGE